jgi:hypothetical protein
MLWLVHLYCILDSEALVELQNAQVMHFFDTKILYWIQCIALFGKLEEAVDMLKQIEVSLHVSTYISLENSVNKLHSSIKSFALLQQTLDR